MRIATIKSLIVFVRYGNRLTFSIKTRLWFLLLFLVVAVSFASGQDQEAVKIGDLLSKRNAITINDVKQVEQIIVISDTLQGWHVGWKAGVNGHQAAYSNWSQGGVNTISATTSTVFYARFRDGRYAYGFSTNLRYGWALLNGKDARKTDDKIAINNRFSYNFKDKRFNIFGNLNFASQFYKGYRYGGEEPKLISRFFAPAYFTQVAGLSFEPAGFLNLEAGIALKETIVRDSLLATRYGLDKGETLRFEPGYSLGLVLAKKLLENVKWVSAVETFSNARQHVRSTDLTFSSELTGKINNFLRTSFQFVLVYDEDFSKQVQTKQVLSMGLSYSIL